MSIKSFVSVFLIFLAIGVFAQEHTELLPCGTPSYRSDWLKNYQRNPNVFDKRNGEILWVPISVAIVGTDEGTGYYSERQLHESLCTLNEDFLESEIQFYLAAPLRYINNTVYAEHTSVLVGAEMMFANNLPNMINCYFVSSASGFCGYNLPYAGIAISASCAGSGDHTWAHEIGHNLSLPHPFLGWEGGVSWDNSVGHNFNDPAPEKVTYDYTYFQDTLIYDTLIIDTAFVEKMDGSNCAFAADGFCDTKPDYLASRWPCDSNLNSMTEQTDPDGVKFYSDGTLFMSYANDNCSLRFTPEQIAAMRANLIDEKSSYLGLESVMPPPAEEVVDILVPMEDENVFYKDVAFSWEPIENATSYSVQIALFQNFGLTIFDTIVYDSEMVVPEFKQPNRNHYIRIKAFNEYNFCSDFIAFGSFYPTTELTTTNDLEEQPWKIFPNPATSGKMIHVIHPEHLASEFKLIDINGKVVWSDRGNRADISTEALNSGLYLLSISHNGKQWIQKISIH